MHLLRTETVFLDEGAAAIDLGQKPADILFLSFSDSDLAGVSSAWREGMSAKWRMEAIRMESGWK